MTYSPAQRRRILALSDERAQWERMILAAERYGYRRGHADGYEQGCRETLAREAQSQREACDHIRPMLGTTTYRRLTVQRWSPPHWKGKLPRACATMDSRTL